MHLLGERSEIARFTAALDVAFSCSYTEAFGNVIGEAMALWRFLCGYGCGRSAWIVGDTGRVVPPRDPEALANAWGELIELGPAGREALGKAARSRVIKYFSLASVVE